MYINFQNAIFYFFAPVLVCSAVGVITARNPVHAALLLVLAFFTSSGLWLLLNAEFLAITLVLVYVGAVMVLLLFVVMLLDVNLDRLREGFWKGFPFGALLALIMAAEISMVIMNEQFSLNKMPTPPLRPVDYSNTKELGRLIYTEYFYAFELAAVILLVAIIAAIALTLRHRVGRKFLDPAQQIAVKKKDRIRVVSMTSETKE